MHRPVARAHPGVHPERPERARCSGDAEHEHVEYRRQGQAFAQREVLAQSHGKRHHQETGGDDSQIGVEPDDPTKKQHGSQGNEHVVEALEEVKFFFVDVPRTGRHVGPKRICGSFRNGAVAHGITQVLFREGGRG